MKRYATRTAIGFILGFALLPTSFAAIFLFMPVIFGVEFFGPVEPIFQVTEGYVITSKDAAEYNELVALILEMTSIWLFMALSTAFFGFLSALPFPDKRKRSESLLPQ